MSSFVTPHQAICTVLRSAGISARGIPDPPPGNRDFNWYNPDGSVGSPYYKDAKEPQPGFPYVVYDIPNSKGPEHTMGDSYPESFDVEIKVIGANPYIHWIGSPWSDPMVSPIAYLDSLANDNLCQLLNGARYECIAFYRLDWEIEEDQTRAPQDDSNGGGVYGNVYIARALYKMEIGAVYPTRTRG